MIATTMMVSPQNLNQVQIHQSQAQAQVKIHPSAHKTLMQSPKTRTNHTSTSTQDPNFIYAVQLSMKHFASYACATICAYALYALQASKNRMKKFASIVLDYANAVATELGVSGSDPSLFLPEPRNLHQILRLPTRYRGPWIAAFIKEATGLIKLNSFTIDIPPPYTPITPVMDIYKCKLNEDGMIDKLKCQIVFCGDLYNPSEPKDSWNPFANYMAFRIFLASCAKKHMFPNQTDLIQAYLQCIMCEQVYIQLPAFWAAHLPEQYRKYCGVPLRLLRALYGYTYSGKCLYEDQAEFLTQQGLVQSPILGIWYRHLPNSGLLLVLLFDTDTNIHNEFRTAIQVAFPSANTTALVGISKRTSNKMRNIIVNQTRYSKAIWQRYIPNADSEPTAADLCRYRHSVPTDSLLQGHLATLHPKRRL
jgi:hypothetical protein